MVMPLLGQVWVIHRILRRRTAFCRNGKSGIRPHGVYAHRKNRDGLSETDSLDRHNLFHDLYSLHLLQFSGSLGHGQVLIIPDVIPPVQSLLAGTGLEFSGIRKYTFHSLRPDSGKQTELRLDILRELYFQSSGNDFHIVHLTHMFFCINIFRDFIQNGRAGICGRCANHHQCQHSRIVSHLHTFILFSGHKFTSMANNATSPYIGILTS